MLFVDGTTVVFVVVPPEAFASPLPRSPPITPRPNNRPRTRPASPSRARSARQGIPQHGLPFTASS